MLEAFVKESCLDHMISLVRMHCDTPFEFIRHYHMLRDHQGLENRLIVPLEMIDIGTAVVKSANGLGSPQLLLP